MYRIKRKPLSVNRAWKGRRFRSVFYSAFHTAVSLLLNVLRPKRPPENRPLFAHYRWGVSNMMADTDNPTKPFQDVLFEHWGMKDHRLQFLIVQKVKTPKGQEFIDFWVRDEVELIEYLEKMLVDLRGHSEKGTGKAK